jgi:hypothetical protein
MLSIFGAARRFCDGVPRREFLRIGAMGIGGLGLADLLRKDAAAAGRMGRARSIINIYLPGGPSHLDTFDLKPDAPAEIRGDFSPIDTNVPGIRICEHLPRLAAIMDKLVVVRSVAELVDEHSAHQSDSGWPSQSLRTIGGRPALGAVVSKLQGPRHNTAPPFVQLTYDQQEAGFLGPVYQPYLPDGPGIANLSIADGQTLDRLGDRTQLLAGLDRCRRDLDTGRMMEALDAFNQRAVGVITSSKLAQAFDTTREDPRLVERYGHPPGHENYQGNERFLLARRLIEAGVRCISLWWGGWDTHGENFVYLRRQLPELDLGLSALVEDLDRRGLLEETLILVSGEFGRTPRINSGAGRDHWPYVASVLMAGGGLRTGQAVGTSNRLGEVPLDRPVPMQEIFATLYHQLGIDPEATTLVDPNGRPQYLVDHRQPMPELV